MSKKGRSWLFAAFIVLFIGGTVAVSLHASGYKLNFFGPLSFNRLLIKTGMIIVSSSPSGARIFLNEEAQTTAVLGFVQKKYLTTEAKLKKILPGDHLLRLEYDGYWPWEKMISVYPGQSTHVLQVNLFRNDVPHLIATSSKTGLQLSPSQRYLYLEHEKKIIAVRNGEITTLNDPNNSSEPGKWRKNTDELILGSAIFSPTRLWTNNFASLIGQEAATTYEEGSNRLYYRYTNTLGYVNLANQNVVLLSSNPEIIAHEARSNTIWWLVKENGSIFLKSQSLTDGSQTSYNNLPMNGQYKFSNEGRPHLTLYDSRHQTLYLIDSSNPLNKVLRLEGVKNWQWLNNGNLIYHNNWEIYRLDVNSGNSYLITRLSQDIKNIIWHPKKNYLILLTAQGLFTYDLRLEMLTQILSATKVSSPALDSSAHTLYFWADMEAGGGIYRLRL